jgi:predicted amidophosphoribosyltransferase
VLDILFPPGCLACSAPGFPFCAECSLGVAVLGPPGCNRCGRPLEYSVEQCADCPPSPIAWARAAFLYEGPIRRTLMAVKFGGLRSAAGALSEWMVRDLDQRTGRDSWVIGWIPLGKARKRLRGFDQAEALARQVAHRTGWPIRPLLRRVTETAPQARRSGPARRVALRGAFEAMATPPPRVLLIDDVLTSGATASECARVLRQAGGREVALLTAARSLGGAVPARCYNPLGLRPGSVVARERVSR